jgi:hypothetical protein
MYLEIIQSRLRQAEFEVRVEKRLMTELCRDYTYSFNHNKQHYVEFTSRHTVRFINRIMCNDKRTTFSTIFTGYDQMRLNLGRSSSMVYTCHYISSAV